MTTTHTQTHILEVCCGSIHSVRAAIAGGAHRVELCAALGEGGLTPSAGLIAAAVHTGIPVQVLIRPRGGDFLYTPDDVAVMVQDIRLAARLGANGVVIGALTSDGDVDTSVCRQLVDAARESVDRHLSITFHRAFDLCRDPFAALADIHTLGCDRILTSGQAQTAGQGITLLRQLVEATTDQLSIMPGSGINADNAIDILRQTGAHEIHASLRSLIHSHTTYHKDGVNMGTPGADEYSWLETDPHIVRSLTTRLAAIG